MWNLNASRKSLHTVESVLKRCLCGRGPRNRHRGRSGASQDPCSLQRAAVTECTGCLIKKTRLKRIRDHAEAERISGPRISGPAKCPTSRSRLPRRRAFTIACPSKGRPKEVFLFVEERAVSNDWGCSAMGAGCSWRRAARSSEIEGAGAAVAGRAGAFGALRGLEGFSSERQDPMAMSRKWRAIQRLAKGHLHRGEQRAFLSRLDKDNTLNSIRGRTYATLFAPRSEPGDSQCAGSATEIDTL
jgi:hypothetical protein